MRWRHYQTSFRKPHGIGEQQKYYNNTPTMNIFQSNAMRRGVPNHITDFEAANVSRAIS